MDQDGRDHQALGRRGEQLAAEHLERCGYRIVERNFRTRWGELDIVAFDGRTLAFCEVKARVRQTPRGSVRFEAGALDAVHPRKRAQVRRMAGSWLSQRTARPRASELRFDAIGLTFDRSGQLLELEHLEGAF